MSTREDTVVGDLIVRHGAASRYIHWSVALFFMGALLSWLPIWKPIFGWMAALFGVLEVCRWLHPFAGLGFAAATIVLFAMWVGDMRLQKGEGAWLGPKLIEYMKFKGCEDPNVGKYNGGQKIFFFLASLLMLCLLLSGIVLWYPLTFAAPLREVSWLLHDASFILFAAAVVFHVYLGTAA